MLHTASVLQFPATQGKLTTLHPLLPGEDPNAYELHHQNYLDHYQPHGPMNHDLATELADLNWRLRRVPSFESELLNLEIHNLKTDPSLKPLVENLDSDSQFLSLAFTRLIQSKVLPNLLNQEARLARRVEKIERRLEISIQQRQSTPPSTPEPIDAIEEVENQKIEANPPPLPIRVPHKPGRNEPCPCNSGLKFKRCCLNKLRPTATAGRP
jgi:hypothetical protein